jgi:hypothetical protein
VIVSLPPAKTLFMIQKVNWLTRLSQFAVTVPIRESFGRPALGRNVGKVLRPKSSIAARRENLLTPARRALLLCFGSDDRGMACM